VTGDKASERQAERNMEGPREEGKENTMRDTGRCVDPEPAYILYKVSSSSSCVLVSTSSSCTTGVKMAVLS